MLKLSLLVEGLCIGELVQVPVFGVLVFDILFHSVFLPPIWCIKLSIISCLKRKKNIYLSNHMRLINKSVMNSDAPDDKQNSRLCTICHRPSIK